MNDLMELVKEYESGLAGGEMRVDIYPLLGDALAYAGHPKGDELAEMGAIIAGETDAISNMIAIAIFDELMKPIMQEMKL